MKTTGIASRRGAAVVLLVAGLCLAPTLTRTARACGGFWCSQTAPVNQAAEQIIFVDNLDPTVTAIIQISYVGPSQKFAWVIPIPGKPDISVSSDTAFERLDTATAPQYTLDVQLEGMCKPQQIGYDSIGGAAGAASSGPTAAGTAQKASVTVVDSGSVGPYDYEVIMVDPQLAQPADVATQWFTAHGYDLTGVDADLLGPYLADGLNLLAFKLTKGSQTGSIRPVILTYESKLPMIPIRPTAVAAQDNMGIKVWVAAQTQAVPENYKSLVINEALIDWFSYTQNYDAVVTAAADEAAGQGFVTELAGPSDAYKDSLFSPAEQQQWQMVQSQSYQDGIDAIFAANNLFRGWDGWRDSIVDAVTLPAGVSIDDFGRNPDAYRGMAKVDTQKFFGDLQDKVVKPVTETQRLLDTQPYLTRLYSTMSADEMTKDPVFTYNDELAVVSNKHSAKQFIECTPDLFQYEAPWRIELPQGGVIRGEGSSSWPIEAGSLPANLKIVQLSTKGVGQVVEDNSGPIGAMLFKTAGTTGTGAAIPPAPAAGSMIGGSQVVTMDGVPAKPNMTPITTPSTGTHGGGACAVSTTGGEHGRASLAWLLFASVVVGLRARRRLTGKGIAGARFLRGEFRL